MSKEITAITPEGLDIANSFVMFGNIPAVCQELGVSEYKVSTILAQREVRKYLDTVYLDTGYRNRNNIASLLDDMIASKLEEARESEVYSSKDLADLLQMAHKMRMDEIKAMTDAERVAPIKNQTNVQINESGFGTGNYGKLMEKLVNGDKKEDKCLNPLT